MKKNAVVFAIAVLAVNAAIFFAYRLLFLHYFSAGIEFGEAARLCFSGLRLDLALLGYEFTLIGLLLLARRRIRPSRLLLWLWAMTGIHLFTCVANFATFVERGQNAGELLLPYITSPWQVFLAVGPFVRAHWMLMIIFGTGLAFYGWIGRRMSRRFPRDAIDLWRNKPAFGAVLLLSILPMLFLLQPITRKPVWHGVQRSGWGVRVIQSKYFTTYSEHARNEAVINPLFEFVRVQVPAQLKHKDDYRLSEADASQIWRDLTGRPLIDPRFPLLTMIDGASQSGIENIIVIQVEGLSRSLLDQERNGRAVMPFLRQMAREGMYFSNTFQNANFTSGGVFSALTGVPKRTFDETSRRFTSFEMAANYASLAHVLGASNYTHFFCEGFRQSWDDFMAFTSRQGCEANGYGDFKKVLERKNRLAGADSLLGICDGEFLQECAEIFLRCPTRFTAHCMTCTTHSPWAVPPGVPQRFDEPALNAFAYFDASLRAFCDRMGSVPAVWDKTVLVVIGDHTSVTFSDNALERLRIPLIFYGPRVRAAGERSGVLASQVDVVPTALGLIEGGHRYAGIGRNLLDATARETGIVSGATDKGLFLKDGFLLRYTPSSDDIQVSAMTNDAVLVDDLAAQQPELARRLKREYFSQIELAKRLAAERRIFPVMAGKAVDSNARAR
ncbi:MAG TPA: sulfatase-like hydrolase/transferase [Verrucomicrobiae bacterium]